MHQIYPIHVYPVLTVLLPLVFFLVKPKWSWLSIVCAVVAEVVYFWDEFTYYEGTGLMIMLTVAQVIVMLVILKVLQWIKRKLKK